MIPHPYRLMSLVSLAAVLTTACASDKLSDVDELGQPGMGEMAKCEDCPSEPPPPPPPPPPPNPCGSAVYPNPASQAAHLWNPADERFRLTHRYASTHGYIHGFPNHHQADYGGAVGPVYGVHFLGLDAISEWRDVPNSELGNPVISDIYAMMRSAHSYALTHGHAAALPTFEQGLVNGQVVRGLYLLRSDAVEFRDVPACELGFPALYDSGQMFRGVANYATRKGFSAAFPTFHSVGTSTGTVYGVVLIKPGKSHWEDVRMPDLKPTCGAHMQDLCNPGNVCDTGLINFGGEFCYDPTPSPPPPPPPPACGGLGEACCTTGNACDDPDHGCDSNSCVRMRGWISVTMARQGSNSSQYKAEGVTSPVDSTTHTAIIDRVENTSNRSLWLNHQSPTNGTLSVQMAAASGATPATTNDFNGRTVAGNWSAGISGVINDMDPYFSVKVYWHRQ